MYIILKETHRRVFRIMRNFLQRKVWMKNMSAPRRLAQVTPLYGGEGGTGAWTFFSWSLSLLCEATACTAIQEGKARDCVACFFTAMLLWLPACLVLCAVMQFRVWCCKCAQVVAFMCVMLCLCAAACGRRMLFIVGSTRVAGRHPSSQPGCLCVH